MTRFVTVLLAAASLLASLAAEATPPRSAPRPPKGRTIYEAPTPLPGGTPGDLIWAEPVPTTVPGARAWRVLYRSTDFDGSPVPATGLVIAPTGKAPADGRRVLTFAHGTTGLARACAPSAVPDPAKDSSLYFSMESVDPINTGIPGLSRLIAAGYVVAATDYTGLGGPGFHRYLVAPAAARNVLDAAVAARGIPEAGAGRRVVVYGWSQGGQATVWASETADYVKGRADVLGAAALAPVNAAAQIQIEKEMAAAGKKVSSVVGVETVMALYASTRTFPDLHVEDVLTPFGVELVSGAGLRQCSQHLGQTLDYLAASRGPALRTEPRNGEAWGRRTIQMALGQVRSQVPVAVFQGLEDTTIYPGATEIYVKEACAKGSTVAYRSFPGVDHLEIPDAAAADLYAWIDDRFAGKPAPSSCGR